MMLNSCKQFGVPCGQPGRQLKLFLWCFPGRQHGFRRVMRIAKYGSLVAAWRRQALPGPVRVEVRKLDVSAEAHRRNKPAAPLDTTRLLAIIQGLEIMKSWDINEGRELLYLVVQMLSA